MLCAEDIIQNCMRKHQRVIGVEHSHDCLGTASECHYGARSVVKHYSALCNCFEIDDSFVDHIQEDL